jgi:hypothetical protein
MSEELRGGDPRSAFAQNNVFQILWPFMAGTSTAGFLTLLAFRQITSVPKSLSVIGTSITGASFVLTFLFFWFDRRHSSYWFVELWDENRKVFKELIKHIVFFAFLFGAVWLLDALSSISHLTEHKKNVLGDVHFYASIISVGTFSVSFIIKVLIIEYQGLKE